MKDFLRDDLKYKEIPSKQQFQNIFLKQSESQKLLERLRNSTHKTYFWSSINPKSCATAQLLHWKQFGKKKLTYLNDQANSCLIHFFYCLLLAAWNTAQQQSQNIFLKQSESQKLRNSATDSLKTIWSWKKFWYKKLSTAHCLKYCATAVSKHFSEAVWISEAAQPLLWKQYGL